MNEFDLSRKQELLRQIAALSGEKERLEAELGNLGKIKIFGDVVERYKDSDTGTVMGREAKGYRGLTSDEEKRRREIIEYRILQINAELRGLNDELFLIENRDSKVQDSLRELDHKQKGREAAIEEKRASHALRYEPQDKLIQALKIAGFNDLASDLDLLKLAFKKRSGSYIETEIELKIADKDSIRLTTKKEQRQIRRSVRKLSREATKIAKKYRSLHILFYKADEIIKDIEMIHQIEISESNRRELEDYFNSRTNLWDKPNLGYSYLEFYRNYSSKYNEDKRKK